MAQKALDFQPFEYEESYFYIEEFSNGGVNIISLTPLMNRICFHN